MRRDVIMLFLDPNRCRPTSRVLTRPTLNNEWLRSGGLITTFLNAVSPPAPSSNTEHPHALRFNNPPIPKQAAGLQTYKKIFSVI